MPHAPFVHLRVRSSYSLLEGAIDYQGLAQRCAALGMPAVAVTDHANLFGVMQFCSAAMGQGVQPIVGALLPLALPSQPGSMTAMRRERVQRPALLPALARDAVGYGNLMRLMSAIYLDNPAETSVTIEDLERCNEGLILLTGGADGPLGRLIQRGDKDGALAVLDRLEPAFRGRLYVELQRHGEEAEALTEPVFLDLAFERGLPLVAANDCLFLDAAMHEAHDALICIAEGQNVANDDRRRFSLDYRFKTATEMAELFQDLPEAIENTLLIARRCAVTAPARQPILPPYNTGAGRDEAEELRIQARAGLELRLASLDLAGNAAIPHRERLEYELDVIVQMQFPGYFLIVSDFIKWAPYPWRSGDGRDYLATAPAAHPSLMVPVCSRAASSPAAPPRVGRRLPPPRDQGSFPVLRRRRRADCVPAALRLQAFTVSQRN